MGRPAPRRRNARADRRRPSRPATSSASASTPATRCAATRWARRRAQRGRVRSSYGGIHATLYPDEARELGGAHAVVNGDGDLVWARGAARLPSTARCSRVYEGGRVDGDDFLPGALGSAAARALHVGVGADRARLPEALLVLLGLAHRRPAARASAASSGRAGDRRASAPRVPLHRARRRQLLSCHARGSADGGAARRQVAPPPAGGDSRRALRADGTARASCPRTWCSSRRSRWRRPRTPSSSTR